MGPEPPPISPRPQPIGVFPPPAGYLLLTQPPESAEPLARLLAGDARGPFPDRWRFFEAALAGDLESTWHQLQSERSPHAMFNRFVLRPDRPAMESLRRELGGEWAELADVVAFALGLTDEVPVTPSLTGELAALAQAVHAAQAIERGDSVAAEQALHSAIDHARPASPLFAAQLLAQRAELRRCLDDDNRARAIDDLREAILLANGTGLDRLLAELWLALGMTFQEQSDGRRGPLLEAIKAYQECLRHDITAELHGDLYAQAHHNLALAYLTMPRGESSDQLRLGIAVQSLREALRVYDRERHPRLWASTMLNLASALQYLPSSHPEENLIQAVELYEEILQVRDRSLEPLGYARVLADQGNALAHLGAFAPSLEKLNEAHRLLHLHGEPDSASAVLDLVGQIHGRRAEVSPAGES